MINALTSAAASMASKGASMASKGASKFGLDKDNIKAKLELAKEYVDKNKENASRMMKETKESLKKSEFAQKLKAIKKEGDELQEGNKQFNINEKPAISNKDISDTINKFKSIIDKNKKGYAINSNDFQEYTNIENKLKALKEDPKLNADEIEDALQYVDKMKGIPENEINEDNIINTKKTVIEFKRIADICKLLIKILTLICIILLIITLLISFINVINLSIKILTNILSLFYNTVVTNNQTISYSAKEIIKCSKNNFKYDIFNILNEQSTSLTVFNTAIYIIYILLFYVIIYILVIIFVNIYQYTHVLNGELKDIDPKFQLLTIIAMIFICSFVHLLIYKFIFRKLSFNKFKDINNYEVNIDNLILTNINPINTGYDNDFFDLLTDSTKRAEIDNMFATMVENVDQPSTNLSKYLLMYDLYMYFDEYVYMNDVVKDDLRKYFKLVVDENSPNKTFISFLDANERKLIKLYHEELPFYKQIPTDKLESFQKSNEKVSQVIGTVNKSIIKYTGTFYPFLICCIYIIGIFLFNAFFTYIIMDFILTTEDDKMFPNFLYTIANKYTSVIKYIYNIFKI